MMAKKTHLVCQHMEQIPAKALVQYQHIIREYIRRRHGVYALYKRDKLYYVGLARNLVGRLGSHLRDRHRGLWDRFSVYLTIENHHIKELESMVLRITKPKGNSMMGRFPKSQDLKKLLKKEVIKEVPIYKCVVEYVCADCCGRCGGQCGVDPSGGEQASIPDVPAPIDQFERPLPIDEPHPSPEARQASDGAAPAASEVEQAPADKRAQLISWPRWR